MSLISLRAIDDRDSGDSSVDLKVEFGFCGNKNEPLSAQPTRITAQARDLTDWDAASTCPSDDESVILFDAARSQTCFVVGSSVIFRNLKPEVLGVEIDRVVKSLGLIVWTNCPTFHVAQTGVNELKEFNLGFAAILMSGPEEATLLNFLLHSHGMDEQLTTVSNATVDDFEEDDDLEEETTMDAVGGILNQLQRSSFVH